MEFANDAGMAISHGLKVAENGIDRLLGERIEVGAEPRTLKGPLSRSPRQPEAPVSRNPLSRRPRQPKPDQPEARSDARIRLASSTSGVTASRSVWS